MKFLSRIKSFRYRLNRKIHNVALNISDTFRILEKSVDSSDLDFYIDLWDLGLFKKYNVCLKIQNFVERNFINFCKFYFRV